MKTLLLLLALTLTPQQAVLKAYHALTPADLNSHVVSELPDGGWKSVDASDRIRSISFGHRTTLWLNDDGVFYVEYGRSTNAPGKVMGPFRYQ